MIIEPVLQGGGNFVMSSSPTWGTDNTELGEDIIYIYGAFSEVSKIILMLRHVVLF